MSDELDRAVDAQIDAYRPDAVPPFSAIEARKRARDRRRMGVGAVALSVFGFAAAVVVVPSLAGGGDRLTPGQSVSGTARTAFAVQYTPAAKDVADPSLGRCLELPGAQGTASLEQSDPPTWIVAVEGTNEQAADVRGCLEGLRDATVRTVPADDAEGDQMRTFRVSSDGTASPEGYTAGVEKCLALPGVTGSSVQESYPATYELRASGAAADALAGCLAAAPGAGVEASGVERAAVRPATDSYDQALARGVLRADPRSGCLWLESPDGAVGPQLLLYGESYRVDFSTEPVSVLDGDRVVARVGEQVEVGGGVSAQDGVAGCPVGATPFLGYFDRK